ncbi:hypothetical protein [Singulisphaera sp. PoT]|uniref:hypothetical protein n=1 Tax=Singulisphaera sp. PoT TaxID=3411797 RepID=UPI003BF5AE35
MSVRPKPMFSYVSMRFDFAQTPQQELGVSAGPSRFGDEWEDTRPPLCNSGSSRKIPALGYASIGVGGSHEPEADLPHVVLALPYRAELMDGLNRREKEEGQAHEDDKGYDHIAKGWPIASVVIHKPDPR